MKQDFAHWVWESSTRRQLFTVYWWCFFNSSRFKALVYWYTNGMHFQAAMKCVKEAKHIG